MPIVLIDLKFPVARFVKVKNSGLYIAPQVGSYMCDKFTELDSD
jgi:hypothetical protein